MNESFALTAGLEEIRDHFEINKVIAVHEPRSRIEPTEDVPIIVGRKRERMLVESRWGLFPFWAKDSVHADLSGVLSKPIFDRIVKKQRCVVPGTALTRRMQDDGKVKRQALLTVKDRALFGMAGIYEERIDPRGGLHRSFTIVTTAPAGEAGAYFSGVPLFLEPETREAWLDPSLRDKTLWQNRLGPIGADRLKLVLETTEPAPLFFH
ncbi:hypothetical protein BG53_03550 [Paenibacillus darwinianus]|uniref:Abasic site processing protein n=1 Tax=Paenibacillus darwinianus TaxID=1380763 RepID=A0A9W5W749_9BACL|nr:SOS response-associated peptidase family protein [Paenibacillus darwinianus]EXX87712.1 hypothetical protein BG53_03550 [Paenibacillus darwinianus]EXX90019.1 hypothetical protein BG52_14345 [Paenibacillus darwinianus]EXX90832.1 hypothetical protein CH50_14690 [Paenibacillus darwinianus]